MDETQDTAATALNGQPLNGLEIAVIGMAGRFPSAPDVDAFWRLLKEGREGYSDFGDDELDDAGVPAETRTLPNYVRKRGVIARKREFDAELFGYTSRDAATMDPQFGVFHEVAWEALERAGYQGGKYDGLIGVYAGASGNLGWMHRVVDAAGTMADYYSVTSLTEAGYLATRVAHRLDLTGPAISVNTTCSTSLVNIHLACQGLNTGECDIALAGGVSVSVDNKGYLYQDGMVLSPDGRCRPFDAEANGTASGEGCGVLVLKRLEDALADNDTVLAVIKGSAINNDGQRKVAFTAPSSEGQSRVIRAALERAEVDPESIGYVEAHGTATKLGDPIEIAALKQAFGPLPAGACAIGSVKSNVGHLGEAAGVAGVIKAILALRHRQLPPSLNFAAANPLIGLENSPFFVNTELREWRPRADVPLRAGVSSFGIGGTNAHLILEEADADHAVAPVDTGRVHHPVLLSANSASALDALERSLAEHAAAHPQLSVADVAYTLQIGRKDLPYRRAFVATDVTGLAVRACDEGSCAQADGVVDKAAPRLCFLFPGQGTQYRGMGKELYEREPAFRECMDACFAVARRVAGIDLHSELYGGEGELTRTDLAQPLLFAFEYSLACVLRDWGLRPHAYLGHSIGEYVAACLTGVFSLEDALAVVIARGRLIQTLPAGAMLAVPLNEARVDELIAELPGAALDLAAINAPERVTVSGDPAAIEELQRRLTAQGVDSVRLHTSHAFHSRHLDPVLENFAEVLRSVRLSVPTAPFLSNVTGDWITAEDAMSPDYWVRHLRQAVRFADCVQTLCRDEAQVLLEVGPGQTLGRFAQQNKATAQRKQSVSLVPQARERVIGADDARLFEGLCQLFVAGIELDARAYYQGQRRRRVPLPTYPFEGRCHYPPELLRAVPGARVPVRPPLAATAPDLAAKAALVGGLTPVQAKLGDIWKKYLGLEDIGLHDDVFDLGVDSLLSIRVITEIRETFAADISLDIIFVLRTVAEQAAEIERKLGAPEEAGISTIRARVHRGPAPLSTSQKRLWIVSQLESGRTAYNNGFCMFLEGADPAVLERAFCSVIERHSILRTRYFEADGQPMQEVREEFDFRIERADLSELAPERRFAEGERMWQDTLSRPIDLRDDLMLRAKLVRYDERTDLLMVTQHHICSDNWSNNLLMQEVSTLYDSYLAGAENPLPPLPLQYVDFALWQEEWLRTGVLERQMPYWRKALKGIPHVHNLPLDRPRPKYQSYRGRQYARRVDAEVLDGLNRIGHSNGATLFMTMQAAFSLFLSRYSGESDIVLGFSVANRMQKELEGLIGFFVNSLVLRSDLSGNPTFNEFLGQTKKKLLGAYANAHVPFEMLVDELKPARSMSYEPLVQIHLIYLDQSQDQGGRVAAREDQQSVVHADMQVPFSKYDLTLYFNVIDGGLALTWEYATDLFEATTVRRMAESFEALLRGIVASPERAVRALPMSADQDMALAPAAVNEGDSGAFEFSLFYFASDDGGRTDDKYRLLMEGARFADRYGFEAVWTPERHFDAFGGAYPNPAITAAALAAATRRIKLRAGSCVLPLHNPVRVAEDWSVIDNISGGRVGIGFAAGFSARDFALAPDKFETRRDALANDVRTVKALWRGESVEMPNGKGEATQITIRPRPIQPELPVWVTTVGNEDAFRHAGRLGDNILTHLMGHTLEELAKKVAVYREERAAAGHAGSGTITLLVHTFIADDEQVIFDKVRGPFKQYLIDSVGTPQTIAKTLGLGDIGATLGESGDIDAVTEFAFRRYYQTSALFGTPDRCLPLVRAIREAGVNEVACLIDFGVEPELVLESLPRLGRLRDLAIPSSAAKVLAVPVLVDKAAPPPDAIVARRTSAPIERTPDPERCMHRQFEAACDRDPTAVAVVAEGVSLTYAELNARANRLAHYLITERGAGPDQYIGLCVSRSVHMLVGLFAILKSGAAYVPIEPDHPAARVAYLVDDGGIDTVLICASGEAALAESRTTRIRIDGEDGFNDRSDVNPDTAMHDGHALYVIYTSGSTGMPKGVVVEHGAAANFADAMAVSTHAELPVHARVTLNSSFGFDVSLFAFLQLFNGHAVYIVPQAIRADGVRLLAFLRENAIDVLETTPSQFSALLGAGMLEQGDYQPARVLLAGEAINAAIWNRIKASTLTRYYNLYGPTECTIAASIGRIASVDDAPHIGRPISGAQFHVLDAHGQPVPRGAVGELYIGGAPVARGYLNRPELSAERFLDDPSGAADARLYRTGDLVRWMDDGNFAYLGRNDLQVKLRGFRIEVGEIESRLLECEGVAEAAVLARGEDSAKFLVAYIVPADAGTDADALQTALKRALTETLPAYMVPQSYAFLDRFPLNNSGKLDRGVLAQKVFDRPATEYLAPRNDTERVLAEIWSELINMGDISVRADFFELGGQSLVAISAVNEIIRRLDVELETRIIFEYTTIEALAAYIDNLLWVRPGGGADSEEVEAEGELEVLF